MTAENIDRLSGFARLDAVKQAAVNGEKLPPITVAQVLREAIPTTPTRATRKAWKNSWLSLQTTAREELGQ